MDLSDGPLGKLQGSDGLVDSCLIQANRITRGVTQGEEIHTGERMLVAQLELQTERPFVSESPG
jgi:hypothetical protein